MVESGGLENRWGFTPSAGSNPVLSATSGIVKSLMMGNSPVPLILNLVRFAHNWNNGTMESWNNGFWDNAILD